jgi:hypothetical protein
MGSMKTNESYQIDNSFDVFYVYNVQWSTPYHKICRNHHRSQFSPNLSNVCRGNLSPKHYKFCQHCIVNYNRVRLWVS